MKKVLIILSGGYNVRNFIYSGFLKDKPKDLEVTFWHTFDTIKELENYNQEKLPQLISGKLDWIKKTINIAELYKNYKRTKRKSYLDYIVLPSYQKGNDTFKIYLLKKITFFLGKLSSNKRGLKFLNAQKNNFIRKSNAYKVSKEKLINENFDAVFFTHQRASEVLGVSIAANDLKMNTNCFIYSWDNLPKGNKILEATNYFVWSNYMKNELLHYYPKVKKENIFITGSPQFVHYKLESFNWTREEFCEKLNLDFNKKYICFSGNDRTTCPVDPIYLNDLAIAVKKLKEEKKIEYHILFRPNPIDRNENFDAIVKNNSDVITEIIPSWKGEDIKWNKGIPTYHDMLLLKNTIMHSEVIINMSSTMSMDAALLNKPAIYIRYDVPSDFHFTVKKTYNFIHFDALKGIDTPVIWLTDRNRIKEILSEIIVAPELTKKGRDIWVEKVINHPIENANKNIWNTLKETIHNEI